jgi:hypothetical protein
MGISEVRSPWSLDRGDPHPRRGESPGSRSSPSNAVADSGHLVRSPGKGPAVRRPDNEPVTGENRNAIEERRLVRENADRK